MADSFTEEQQEALRDVWGLNARTLAEVQQIVRGQWRTLRRGLLTLAVIALASGVLSVALLIRQGSTVGRVHSNQSRITALAHTNRALAQQALSLGHAIQQERIDACRDENHRNAATVARLRRLEAQAPPRPSETAVQRARALAGTIDLIDALAPVRDCGLLVTPPRNR